MMQQQVTMILPPPSSNLILSKRYEACGGLKFEVAWSEVKGVHLMQPSCLVNRAKPFLLKMRNFETISFNRQVHVVHGYASNVQ